MRDVRFWSFLALVLTATGCSGGFPSQATPASDWTQSSTIPPSTRSGSFGEAEKYLRKKLPGYTIIDDFGGSPDGSQPRTSLYSTKNAWPLIGTTLLGGASNNGTLYGMVNGTSGSRREQVLYSFGSSSSDGTDPVGFAIDYRQQPCCPGYVATESGGTSNNGTFAVLRAGTSGAWSEGFLYSFNGTPDGAVPFGNPIEDAEGNIYGTTEAGGAYGFGTVYRMQPSGTLYGETILHSFDSGDGQNPYGALIMDRKDNLYGTTYAGGSAGEGTVFKLTPSKKGGGYTESILHSFQGAPYDGSRLTAGPCGGPADSIYGTTEEGGTNNVGTVYKLTPSGNTYKETIVWNFGSVQGDGAYPVGGVIVNRKGVIYGTTLAGGSGGSSGLGAIFSLTPSSATTGKYEETVYSFTGTNGAYPYAAPTVDENRYMYFTTSAGGTHGDGTVIISNEPVGGVWTSLKWTGCT